jgi:hypothetical protein
VRAGRLAAGALAAASLALGAPPAFAGSADRLDRSGAPRFEGSEGSASARGYRAAQDAARDEQALRTRVRLRTQDRDAKRSVEDLLARARGEPEDARSLRQRELGEEQEDALRGRVDLDALERWSGQPLGPVTREVLGRSLDLYAAERRADVETEARAREERARSRSLRGLFALLWRGF